MSTMQILQASHKYIVLMVLGCLFLFGGQAEAKVFLVSVGVAEYPDQRQNLNLPVKDATTMAELYQQNNGANVTLITNKNATVQHILEIMKKEFAQAKEDDIVVLFFSGHGMRGSFCAYDGFLTYKLIREAFATSKCRNKMIFADACLAGGIRQNKKEDEESPEMNVLLFLSSRDNESSIENKFMKNGFFTSCLERCLRGGADVNRDRVITAKELFDAVSFGVKQLSNDKQHPVMWGNFDSNMPVMRW